MTDELCPCCGHAVESKRIGRPLTATQQRIVNALMKADTLTRNELFEIVYGHRKDGGPLWLDNINVQAHLMRHKLARFGMQIVATRGHYARWRLEAQ